MTSRSPETGRPKYNGKRLSKDEMYKRMIGALEGQRIVAAKSGHIPLLKNAKAISSYINSNSRPDNENPEINSEYWESRRKAIKTLEEVFSGKEAEKIIIPIDGLSIDESIFGDGDAEVQKFYDALGVGAMPPIVINEKNEIVDGGYRVRSIFKNGATHVCAYRLQAEGQYEINKKAAMNTSARMLESP